MGSQGHSPIGPRPENTGNGSVWVCLERGRFQSWRKVQSDVLPQPPPKLHLQTEKKRLSNSYFDDFTGFPIPAGHVFTQLLHLQVEFFASSRCDDFWPRRALRFHRPVGVRFWREKMEFLTPDPSLLVPSVPRSLVPLVPWSLLDQSPASAARTAGIRRSIFVSAMVIRRTPGTAASNHASSA